MQQRGCVVSRLTMEAAMKSDPHFFLVTHYTRWTGPSGGGGAKVGKSVGAAEGEAVGAPDGCLLGICTYVLMRRTMRARSMG